MALDFSRYDARHYRTVSVEDGYREWSKNYDERMTDRLDAALLQSLEIDWPSIGAAADLACGTGRTGAWLRERGVGELHGIDLCPEMLEHAASKSIYKSLRLEDICDTSLEAGSVALAINALSCEHLASLAPLYRETARVVRPDGAFVLVGYHPHFLLNGVPTHFKNTEGENIAVDNHIHLISDHVTAARASGWQLDAMGEQVVDDEWVSEQPSWSRHRGRPVSYIMAWRKRA